MTITRIPYPRFGERVSIAGDDDPGNGSRPDLWPSVGEYPIYDPFLYYAMTHDGVRNTAFRSALHAVAMGRTVLDIGTGQDLNWALEAARQGASQVVAVEAMRESYEAAAAKLAGLEEAAIVSLRFGPSFGLSLERRAQVCVAELIGSIASAEGMLAAMADAHARLLAPGAVVVPARCRTMVGAVSLRSLFPGGLAFSCDSLPYLEKIFGGYGRAFDIRLAIANPDPKCVASTVEPVEDLRFDGSEPLDATTEVRLEMLRAGPVDGLLCWIRLHVSGTAEVIDSLRDKTSWIPGYLPLFDDPVAAAAGDVLTVRFDRQTSDDGVHPDYAVEATLRTVTGSCLSSHHGPELGASAVHRELLTSGGQ